MMHRSRLMVRAVCGALAMFALLCVGASSAWAGIGFSPTINIPQPTAPVSVGQQNLPSQLRFVNISDAPQDASTLTLSNITVVPACRVQANIGSDCPQPDPGVIRLDATATGRAGTACAGNTFSVTNISIGVQDKYLFTPLGGPVVLGPANGAGPLPISCIIDFTVDILKAPTTDARLDLPNRQTANIAGADGMTSDGAVGNAYQTNVTTILAVPLTATTVATTTSPFTSFSDSITLAGMPAGAPAPTGTVTFLAYGPNDSTCADATPLTDGPRALTGLTTSSGPFDPPGPGDYTFRVTYSGDSNYLGFTTPCGEPNETVNIPAPQIQVVKTASPLSRVAPGGTFTFTLVVSNPSPNVPITITTLTDDIYGNIGTNPAASNTCDDLIGNVLAPGASAAPCSFDGTFTGTTGQSQTDIVTVLGTDANGFTATDTDDATVTLTPVPQIQVVKTASPLSRPAPGGTFTFALVVSNPGPNAITITTLTDDIYGNIGTNPAASNTCDDLIGDVLAPGASAPCSFEGNFTGAAGASQTDVVTVVGSDESGTTATDTDDATVTLTRPSATPVIAVTKAASPATRPAPGGDFTFTVTVSNPSASVPIKITALTDDVYGNMATIAGSTCGSLIGVTLAPGATSAPCSFPGRFTGAAGARQTDTVTVTGVDSDGNTTSATAQATVGITAPPASPPPAQAVAAVSSGTARVSGPTGCAPRPFSVLVTGRRIRRVTFYLDGRRVRSLTRPNSGTRYLLRVTPGSLSRGTHRVLAVTSFTAASGTKQRTLRLVFQRCARQAVAPRFAG